jgi:hypothetical protein
MIFHGVVLLIVTLLGTLGFWRASLAESGPGFLVFISVSIVSIVLIPGLIYRMYSLQRARYILARDGISLFWGLRHEEIPINQVNWVGSAEQNKMTLSKPFLRLPGAVLGTQAQADGKPIEFLAARDTKLVLIVTPQKVFAISPAQENEFLQTYRRLAEFGSLSPIPSVSDYPTFLLARSWADRPARILIISSALLTIGLILWVSLSLPNHATTTLRLNADGSAVELVPGIRLLLLPVLNTFFFISDLLLGLFFYRRQDTKALGYLMWASSVLTSLLFSGAVFFILQVT